jgi:hypothetical protein
MVIFHSFLLTFTRPGMSLDASIINRSLGVGPWYRDEQKSIRLQTFTPPNPVGKGSDRPTFPLVNVYITIENPPIFNGKIHYFYDHVQ